ncbi:kinase-like protein [Metschnikowia bicuspidata var. bicuspidata NRRL YB-4993]|uniref:non-specific serine/threonine protein kinase n=1 Tax=Metschnikowia bicuspidata var. bicuspidata NRRL YB-4993 TaxID=869754 RepID=A0A1A0H4M1_9ASCO|nr:kinase-like protein [Metschnikowia bicuspidata var. bicuspidata NRRL YB-4993]OBA19024.1 kinase-like protein [Metschnikowia bicuspidata var. bicuspidata NRRL YB-4993]
MSTATSIASRSYFDHQNADTSVSDLGDQTGNNRSSVVSRSSATPKKSHREIRFGAYILGSTLGEGEFGKVKLGWRKDGKHPSQVAIKLIKRDTIVKDLESEIKIYREINSLRLLNHPNIVNLVEVLKSGKYIGIVLEYASGGELFDFILKQKYLKENVAKKLFAQLVSGVDYMHSKGLIHRDLKLENLLLDKHKNIVISDFGFVNSYNKSKNDLMKTSCGSPCYAAPELVLTQSPYAGRKVDIWSIGVILYAMLAGYLPFDDDAENEDGADIVKLYNYICNNPLTFPEYISPLARDLLRKIIVPNPAKRISMDEIRSHPWLAPHANLLSIRQLEWDRIITEDKERRAASRLVDTNKQKRYSMFNETTSSSALMLNNSAKTPHGRSYTSNSNIIYANPTTLSSFANVVALPNDIRLDSSTSVWSNSNAQAPYGKSGRSDEASPTRSDKASFPRGHTKSTSMSGSYPSASFALKAIVSEHDKPTENESNQSVSTPRVDLSRVSTFTGNIPTIAESPTLTEIERTVNGVAKNFVPMVERLPHGQRRPRPTSYHPGSMSSSLSLVSTHSAAVLDYIKMSPPMNLSAPQFRSASPTKSLHKVDSAVDSETHSSPGSLSTIPTRNSTRRDSVVTPINVNGVLSSDIHSQENKRNLVLSYLEDKMDTLELTELHSPVRVSVQDWEMSKASELQKPGAVSSVHENPEIKLSRVPGSTESPIAELLKLCESSPKRENLSEKGIEDSEAPQKESRKSEVIQRRDRDKENREVRRNKKKNRFSILSFYSTSNASSNTISSSAKKVLEPSNEANLSLSSGQKDQKVAESSTSVNASLTKRTSTSTASTNTSTFVNGREASAARKVMNFFKRKSVRIG